MPVQVGAAPVINPLQTGTVDTLAVLTIPAAVRAPTITKDFMRIILLCA